MPAKKPRRARGSGSIFWSEYHGCWIGRVTVAGHRCEVRGATQGEVVRKLAAVRPPGPTTTVGEWAARWLGAIDVRPGTARDYEVAVRCHVVPRLGGVRLTALTAHDVERFAAALLRAGKKPGTVSKVVGTLRTCLSAAVRARVIAVSPAALARRPKRAKTKVEPLSPADLRRVIEAAPRYTCGGVIALCAGCGCRVGEALALDVTDYDPATGMLSITKTYDTKSGLGPPKSPHSVRTIRVPEPVRPFLARAIHKASRPTLPLFRTAYRRRFPGSAVNNTLARLLRRLGLPRVSPHKLRHHFASHMIAARVPVADVAAYLGDTVLTVTRVYVHATSAVDPSRVMERLLTGARQEVLPAGS